MIPNAKSRDVQSEGVSAQGVFGISSEDTAHIMGILRDTLYTDRVLAVLREYAANAWDANREAGKGDKPIVIHIPTNTEPTLTIRDHGLGLSDEAVFKVYTQYGKSTKRDSDVAVGMLGIGSKSAFAYSDTFTITSWHKGMKRIYVAALDDSDLGIMQRLHEEPCAANETGIEVKIAIRPEDLWEFQNKARNLYSYFIPRPQINIDLRPEKDAAADLESGIVFEDDGEWLALMGCVPYRINTEQLRGWEGAEGLWVALGSLSGILKFDIGEVEISASREELKYTKKTKTALLNRFESLIEEYVEDTLKMLKTNSISEWAKRLRLHGMSQLGLPMPNSAQQWSSRSVNLYTKVPKPGTESKDGKDGKVKKATFKPFAVLHGNTEVVSISVNANSRLVIKDDPRKLSGFNLRHSDYVVSPLRKTTVDECRKALAKMIKMAKLTGIEVVDISTMPFSDWKASKGRTTNKKHQVRSFRLVGTSSYGSRSENWEIVDREPTDEDVYVIISRFEAVNFSDFYRAYSQDKRLAAVLGIEMPEVYGYKTTEKKPLTDKDCQGTPYNEWRDDYFKGRMTTAMRCYLAHHQWANVLEVSEWAHSYRFPLLGKTKDERAASVQAHLEKLLGDEHPIVDLFAKHVSGFRAMQKVDANIREVMPEIIRRFGDNKGSPASKALKALNKLYPLFSRHADISDLWEADDRYADKATFNKADEWVQYIKMMDEAREENVLTSKLARVG